MCTSGTQRREALLLGHFEALHSHYVNSVMFSPDGKHVVSGSWDNTIFILDVETGLTVVHGPIRGHTGYVNSVAFSPDGKFVVSGSNDKTICIWHADTGTLAYGPMKGHTQDVTSVAFSPDGRCVVSGSDDRTIRIWDVETGAIVVGPFRHNGDVRSVTISPDRKHIVSCSNASTIYVWGREDTQFMPSPNGTTKASCPLHTQKMANTSFQAQTTRQLASGTQIPGAHISGPFRGHTSIVTFLLHFRRTANVLSRAHMTPQLHSGMWRDQCICFRST